MIRLAPRPTKPKTPSINTQIEQATAQGRIWRDLSALPDVIWRSWCQSSFTLVESDPQSAIRFIAFVRNHARCGRNHCKAGSESSHATE